MLLLNAGISKPVSNCRAHSSRSNIAFSRCDRKILAAMEEKTANILVLGAGFGGLTFCQKFRHARAHVTVVDRTNHHLFQPLLYQVAGAGLSPADIAQPVRSILSNRPEVTVLLEQAL